MSEFFFALELGQQMAEEVLEFLICEKGVDS